MIVLIFVLRNTRKKRLLKRIKRMEHEEKAINGLMRKTQIARFKLNTISGIVYNIRMDKYKSRLNKIQEDLPVLRDLVRKIR